MGGLIPGLALGGLWIAVWALAEVVIGGVLTAWPGVAAILLPAGFAGGVIGASLPRAWAQDMRRWTPPALVAGAVLVWGTGYLSFHFLLTHSFDLLREIAAIFASLVLGSAFVATALVWVGARRDERPAGRGAAALPLIAAIFAAFVASRITSRVLGFEVWTLAIAGTSSLLATHSLMMLVPEALLSRRNHLTGLAGALTLVLAGGLGLYSGSPAVRWATWRGVPVARSLASTFANITDADVDGISGSLGHPDCDDSMPHVYPGARELAGNGRDDNCNGADVSADAVRALWTGPQGVRASPPLRKAAPETWNVILLTVDALRWDHMSLAGYHRATTPNLDMIARTCLVFEQAWAASNYTATSLYSLFTGLYPSAFLQGTAVIARPGIELSAQLARAGYATEAIIDIHPVPQHLLAGFAKVDTSLGIRASAAVRNRSSGSTAKELTQLALQATRRLGSQESPFFLWVHYSEPHAEYLPHEQFGFGPEELDLYDGEIAFADAWIGQFLAELQEAGRFEDTLIVITSDHGEAFGEHGTRTHGQSLYEEELHVPLLVHFPGSRGKRISTPVDLTDVLPTMLDALGRRSRFPTHGETLLPHALTGAPLRTPEAFSETRLSYARLQALRVGDEKVILDHLLGTVERFDLGEDPEERSPDRSDAHRARIGEWTDLHLSWPHTAMHSAASLPGP